MAGLIYTFYDGIIGRVQAAKDLDEFGQSDTAKQVLQDVVDDIEAKLDDPSIWEDD